MGFSLLSRKDTKGYARSSAAQTQASWEPGKHNARHGFLNRSRSIWTIISVAATRAFAFYVCGLYTDAHLDATYVYVYVCKYVCVLCMLFLSGTPHGLSSRSTGQWLAASTALFRSTPALYSASYTSLPPVPFVSRQAAPSSHLHSVSTSSSSLLRVIQCLASLGSFVLSFVRSCYSCREQPGVSETSMRDSSSFLVSSLHPYSFPFALPFPPLPASGHPRAPLFSATPTLPRSNPARFHG